MLLQNVTTEQLSILIKDGDVLQVGIGDFASLNYIHNKQFSSFFFKYEIVSKDESYIYFISNDIFNIICKIYEAKLNSYIQKNINSYKKRIDNYLLLNTTSKEEIASFYKGQISDINKIILKLYANYLDDDNIERTQKNSWLSDFSFRILIAAAWIKFDLFNGKKINPNKDFSKIKIDNVVFKTLNENTNFEIVLCLRKILLLKSQSSEIKNVVSDLTYKQIALVCIIKDIQLYNKESRVEALQKYAPNKKDQASLFDYYKLLNKKDSVAVEKDIHPQAAKHLINDLKAIEHLLTPNELIKLNNIVDTIKIKVKLTE